MQVASLKRTTSTFIHLTLEKVKDFFASNFTFNKATASQPTSQPTTQYQQFVINPATGEMGRIGDGKVFQITGRNPDGTYSFKAV